MNHTSYHLKNSKLLSKEERENPLITGLLTLFIIIMGVMLVFAFLFQLCKIDGSSMENSYSNNQYVLVTKSISKVSYKDVVILDAVDSKGVTTRVIKRIIATSGEKFRFVRKGYYAYLQKYDAKADEYFDVNESGYIKNPMSPSRFEAGHGDTPEFLFDTPYTVPPGQFLFLGDNRDISKDSRNYGFGKSEWLVGKVVFSAEKNSFMEWVLRLVFFDFGNNTKKLNAF